MAYPVWVMPRSHRRVCASLAALAVFACGGVESTSTSLEIPSQDERFRIELSRPTGSASGQLRLRVEPRAKWKLVPESAARLETEAPPGFRFALPAQGSEDALTYTEERLEFGLDLQRATGKASAPPRDATAELKFGVCADKSLYCEIVNEHVTLPLEAAWQ